MTIDIAAWRPQARERVLIKGSGGRSDFLSVQTVTTVGDVHLSATGAWRFDRRATGWHAVVDDRIMLHPQPQLNPDIEYPMLPG